MRYLPLLFAISVSACAKRTNDATVWVKAEVVSTADINCGLTVLSFAEDSVAVRSITGRTDLIYIAKTFPPPHKVVGAKVAVKVRTLKPGEEFACITLGPTYPAIDVTAVQSR